MTEQEINEIEIQRAPVIVVCLLMSLLLGLATIILVPNRYLPSTTEPLGEEFSIRVMFEQLMTIQGLVGISPIIYFFLLLSVAYLLIRKWG